MIADIARRVKKTGRYTETAELMAKSMVEQGYSAEKIQAEVMKRLRADKAYQMAVAENTKEHKQKIQDIIDETVKKAKTAGEQLIAEAGNMAWNNDLSMWSEQGVDLKKPNTMNQLMLAFQKQTVGQLRNLTKTTGFKNTIFGTTGVMNAYQREMDLALLKVATGTFSYDQAVNDCIKRLAQSGLRSIDYESGRAYQLDTAARMCVRTGMSQLAGKVMEENLKSTGQDLVITSQHMGSRPEHAPWQNKVFSYSGKSKKYPDFFKGTGYGTAEGLKGVNCTHDFYPFWEGASVIPEDIKEPEPMKVNGKTYTYYQATQQQRIMERNIRATKREIEAQRAIGGNTTELESKLKAQKNSYYSFSSAAKLKPKDNRLRIIGGTSASKKKKISITRSVRQDASRVKNADIVFKSKVPSSQIVNDKKAVIKSFSGLPANVQKRMFDITFDMGNNGSSCDYKNGIIYVAQGAEKQDIDHEIGHLIEYRIMDKKAVTEYKKYLVEGLSVTDISKETYYNTAGEAKDVFIVKGDRFVSEYQGRIYASSLKEAVNDDGSINIDLMLETISEPFRMYQNDKSALEKYEKIIELMEGALQ